MNHSQHNQIVGFIWGIADDVLRDVFVRGKYRDLILPMTVLRRLDALLEPTHDAVGREKQFLDENGIFDDKALCDVSGYPFYNTSPFTLKTLLDEPSQLRANFEAYLAAFSPNVREIIEKFSIHSYLHKLAESNRLYPLIQRFCEPRMNLSPQPVLNAYGAVVQPALSNRGMGYVFEELLRKFNEENNEEAGEHFTPRDIIHLMTRLVFDPVKAQMPSSTYTIYDDACGSGGMLTEADGFLQEIAEKSGKHFVTRLFGQEVNAETFAICQSDMLILGQDPQHIRHGSTLARDEHRGLTFDFMMANPPYGKSWKTEQEAISDAKTKEVMDKRFEGRVPPSSHAPNGELLRLIPASSDGQLLFQVNMLSKMKTDSLLGSRIAIVHNGSALFTGDAGSGESNIRRWILENDWLEAIIGLPLKMFYNTGIATYIWVLSSKKAAHRRGKVQLIDASNWHGKLRKNLGQKSHVFGSDDMARILETFVGFQESEQSKIFDTSDFGYRKIVVERPLRLASVWDAERVESWNQAQPQWAQIARWGGERWGEETQLDWNRTLLELQQAARSHGWKLKGTDWKLLRAHFAQRDENAAPVSDGKSGFEADAGLRDTENVPLKEEVSKYFEREVLPHAADAWIDESKTQIGYEISFTKYFYRYTPLRSLEEITRDILQLERETEGLLHRIVDDVVDKALCE